MIMNTSVLLNMRCTGTTQWIQILIHRILPNQYVMIHAAIQVESSTSPATWPISENTTCTVAGSRRSCPTLTRACRWSIIEKYQYVISVTVWKSKVSPQKTTKAVCIGRSIPLIRQWWNSDFPLCLALQTLAREEHVPLVEVQVWQEPGQGRRVIHGSWLIMVITGETNLYSLDYINHHDHLWKYSILYYTNA